MVTNSDEGAVCSVGDGAGVVGVVLEAVGVRFVFPTSTTTTTIAAIGNKITGIHRFKLPVGSELLLSPLLRFLFRFFGI
jgi:hypothetical protein